MAGTSQRKYTFKYAKNDCKSKGNYEDQRGCQRIIVHLKTDVFEES